MIEVPAIRGDDPLGFLAALGILGLSEVGSLPPLQLAWSGGTAPIARLDGAVASVEELAASLSEVLERLREAGVPAPGLRPDFPVPRRGVGTDPMRMTAEELGEWYQIADESYRSGDPWLSRWLIALAGHATVAKAERGDVQLTPFYAPTGLMTLRGSLFDATAEAVRKIDGPGDALTRWRRIAYDGANFDGRATRDGAVTTTGKPANQGAPSPTWLALMALRFFAMIDDGRRTRTVGWQRIRMYQGYTARSLVWPCWLPALDAAAVRTLLGHPALQLEERDGAPKVRTKHEKQLGPLGVTAVFGSSRRTLSQGDGPLGPAHLVWAQEAGGVGR